MDKYGRKDGWEMMRELTDAKSERINDMPIVPTKDRPLHMPCDDPEGCKHFKAEMKLRERIQELVEELDAECRVSQMLLANKKKQNKQIEELGDGIEKMNNKWVKIRRNLETLLEQLIPIAEKADTTDDSEDTTIELAKQALSRS